MTGLSCPECFSSRVMRNGDDSLSCLACRHHWGSKVRPYDPKPKKSFHGANPNAQANRAEFTVRRSIEVAESALALCNQPTPPNWELLLSIQRLAQRQGRYLCNYQRYPNRMQAGNGFRRAASALTSAGSLAECLEAIEPGFCGWSDFNEALTRLLAGLGQLLQFEVLYPLREEERAVAVVLEAPDA